MADISNFKLWVSPVTKEVQIIKVEANGIINGKTNVDPFRALGAGVVGIVHHHTEVDLHRIELDTDHGKFRVSIEAIYEPEE